MATAGSRTESDYEIYRRTRPASGANEGWWKQRCRSDGAEGNQIRDDLLCAALYSIQFHSRHGQISGAGQMANAATAAGGTLLICRSGSFAVMLLVFAHVHATHVSHFRYLMLRHCLMASTLRHLHGHRCGQRAGAEKRQPQQHQYGNEFSGLQSHVRSVAKPAILVNCRYRHNPAAIARSGISTCDAGTASRQC